TPPADTEALTDSWLASLPKVQPAELPDEYMDAVTERTSWWPVDLDPVLRGEIVDHAPEFLSLTVGQPLFYAGKVNGIIGESESGKTWVALEAVKQALGRGQRVLYMDFEDAAPGIVNRLKALGITDFTHFAYMSPDEGLGTRAKLDLSETLQTINPDMAVLDGFNAAMNVLGLDINSNNDATTFAQMLLKPVAATGVCLIYVDHVPKSKDARGKGGIGAQAKRAMTTGCTLAVQVLDPFGRGNIGRLGLSVDKDRAGHVRGYCTDARNLGTVILVSDKDTGDVVVEFDPFDAKTVKESTAMTHRDAVLQVLGQVGEPLSQKQVVDILRDKGHKIGDHYQKPTFEGLAFDGLIVKIDGKWQLHETDILGSDFDE
ncbi:MAG TPA: AAA family ATPase, partial [Pseudomonadales bacterium]|nr:AAA family ATPase [Pseudomonadales bacterium]